jgi:hypothetical protein
VNVGNSVRKAIDDWTQGELESAMLHACNAVDGTAKKVRPDLGSKARFTMLLRENYDILGPMGAPGIDLRASRFSVPIARATTDDGEPDLADVVYSIHRCTHGHGDELPDGFELFGDVQGLPRHTRIDVRPGAVRLSDRMIFGLLAVAVMSPANASQTVPDGYVLTFGSQVVMPINEWWGRAADFPAVAASDPTPQITLDMTGAVSLGSERLLP